MTFALMIAAALLPGYHLAGPTSLDAPVSAFRAAKVPAEAVFLAVSRSYGFPVVVDPAVRGEVTLEVRGGTVAELLDALARSLGSYWERDGRLVVVRRNAVRFYEIDYPQMTRSAQGVSSVVLSAQAPALGPSSGPYAAAAAQAQNATGTAGQQTDQTNISIQQQNQNTFWADVQAELTAMAQPGEMVAVNRLAGLAVVTAPPSRQADFRGFIEQVNRRISRQVRISARVLEVELGSQRQLGVDWALAASRIGGVLLSGVSSSTAFSALGGQALAPATISGTIATAKVSAAIRALEEQGSVRAVSNPSVVSLSNQTAFVKVGTEQTFFSLANSTTINQAGAATPFATTQSTYAQNAITIGTVLYVTPEVNGDGTVTVDILPAVTQLVGIDTSPDGLQTAPRMDIKSLSTLARLHPNESVMLGGLIFEEARTRSRRLPLLGSLPGVGRAFATSGAARSRSELVIFLTAEVVH